MWVRNLLRGSTAAVALALGCGAAPFALAEGPARADTAVPQAAAAEVVPGEEVATETGLPLGVPEAGDAAADPETADPEVAGPEIAEPETAVGDPIASELAVLLGPGGSYENAAIAGFYASQDYAPAWVDGDGLNALGTELLAALANAPADGLNPDSYLHDPIFSRLEVDDPVARAELDIHLTEAFLRFGDHLMNGRFRQNEASAGIRDHESTVDLTQPLRYAVDSGEVTATLLGLAPPHEQYRLLRDALAQYRQLEEGGAWERIPEIEGNLDPGARHSAIPAVRARLAATGEYALPAGGVEDDRYYDRTLADAVELFQERNGLLVDGVIGPRTLAALNGSLEYRIRQIEASMERWRWYPRDFGSKYVMVNVPEFMVRGYEGSPEPALEMRVIVGTRDNQTPIFSDRMEHVSLNPYWHVPQSIADNEYLPELRRDPFYLLNQNIRILSGGQEINPILVDWASMGNRFPYSMRQEPGAGNALGRIKFMFPNRHAVYMHDTPTRSLFQRAVRSFSHGCIRLGDPMAMAEFVFRGQATVERIEELIATGRTRDIILDRTIPVHVAYFTARVDENGVVNFFNDLYQRDQALIQAMDDSAPEAPTVIAETEGHAGLN